MSPHHHEVFSAKKAGYLDTRLRRFLYHPDRLAERYVKPGNRVLDFGCGPGFFTREFAKRVGENGMVFSVDLQEEMLVVLRRKPETEGILPLLLLMTPIIVPALKKLNLWKSCFIDLLISQIARRSR